MKTKIKFLTLTMIVLFLAGNQVMANEKTTEYHEKWPISEVGSLDITNRFGEIKVVNEGGSEITIDVVVTVDAANERAADQLLNMIEISFSTNGKTVKAATSIDDDFNSQRKFSIDYVINVPSDKNLKISNKYGNTVINKLNANGDFNIKYGNFSANELQTPDNGTMKLDLEYGSASIDDANNLDVEVNYSPQLSIDKVKNLKLDSKNSQISVDDAGTVIADSKYDNLTLDRIKSLTSTSKYSRINIDKLTNNLKLATEV